MLDILYFRTDHFGLLFSAEVEMSSRFKTSLSAGVGWLPAATFEVLTGRSMLLPSDWTLMSLRL